VPELIDRWNFSIFISPLSSKQFKLAEENLFVVRIETSAGLQRLSKFMQHCHYALVAIALSLALKATLKRDILVQEVIQASSQELTL
jgi:hypothetical protein